MGCFGGGGVLISGVKKTMAKIRQETNLNDFFV